MDDREAPLAAAMPEEAPDRRRSLIVRLVLLGAAVAVIFTGVSWYVEYRNVGRFMQSTDNAFVQADAVTVSPRIAGYVDAVLVRDNQDVVAGQPLVRIDSRDYRSKTQASQAQIGVASAAVRAVIAQGAEQKAAVDRARAELVAVRAEAAFAVGEVQRYEPLAASGAETREKLAQLRSQATQAKARTAQAEASLVSAERRVSTLDAQVAQARAQADAARAQFESANIDIGATLIRASISGRIGNRTVRPGQYAQAGTRLMSVVPVREIYIEANFKETQIGSMRIGQPVRVEVDALSDIEIRGRVASISPGTGAQFSVLPPQNATGNFTKVVQRIPVRISLDAASVRGDMLVPGMSVEVTVDTRSGPDTAHGDATARGKAERRNHP